MTQAKVLTKSIALAIATTAGIRSFPVDSESDFENVRGFYVIRNSGTDYLKIGVKDAAGNTILAPVNITHLSVGNTVSIDKKFFKETPFRGAGTKFIVTIENFATTAAIQDLDFVYLMDNKAPEGTKAEAKQTA